MVGAIVLPGFFVFRRLELLERITLGAALGVILLGGLAFLRFLVILPGSAARTLGLVVLLSCVAGALVAGAICRAKTQPAEGNRQAQRIPRALLASLVGAALLGLGVEATLPHYDLAARYYDWFVHFDLARIYEHGSGLDTRWGDAGVTTRTPLYNLLGAGAMLLFGDRFQVFQVLTAAVAWLWLLPTALIARRLLRDRWLTRVALLGLSPLLLQTTTYAWSKGLVAFFALLALDRCLALREASHESMPSTAIQLGVVSAATVMTHPGFVGLPLALFGLLLYDAVRRRAGWLRVGLTSAGGLLVALPWYVWAIAQYGLSHTLFGYPLAQYPSVFRWAFDRLLIVVTSLLPITLPLDHFLTNPLTTVFLLYVGTATGLLGLGFLLRSLAQNLKPARRLGRSNAERTALIFAGVGFLVADLLHEGVVSNDGATFGIPTFVVLALLMIKANPLTRTTMALAVTECLLINTAIVAWVLSPAAQGLPNAAAAALNHIRFLGQDLWPVGLVIALAGCVASLIGLRLALKQETGERLRLHSRQAA